MNINPFHATGLFLHPLKTSKNQRFSDVFRGYRKISVTRNGLKQNNHMWTTIRTKICPEHFCKIYRKTWGRQRWLRQATSEQMFFFECWEVFKSISFTEYFCVSNSERCYLWKRIRELTDINYYFKLFKVLNISFFLRYCIRQPQKMVGFWSAAG